MNGSAPERKAFWWLELGTCLMIQMKILLISFFLVPAFYTSLWGHQAVVLAQLHGQIVWNAVAVCSFRTTLVSWLPLQGGGPSSLHCC